MSGVWKYLYDIEGNPDANFEAWSFEIRNTEHTSWMLRSLTRKKNGYIDTKTIEKKIYDSAVTEYVVNEPKKYFDSLKGFNIKLRNSTLVTNSPFPLSKIKSMEDNKPTILQKFSSFLGLGRRKKSAQEEDPIQEAQDAAMEAIKAITKKEKTRERREKVNYRVKYKAKHEAKRKMKKRFKVGNNYILRIKPKDGSREVIMGFQCKKFIYTMNDMPMNIVIMKQLYGDEGKKYTLDRHECQKFHVKYEPGLEVWPMGVNWIPEKKQNSRKNSVTV